MTYGWAILVVLAAIGALAYFGVLSPDRFLPERCTMQGFTCDNDQVRSDAVEFRITNNLGVTADDVNVSISTGDPEACSFDTTYYDAGTLENRGQYNAVFSCTGGTTISGVQNVDITVSYTRAGETVVRDVRGTLTGQP